MTGAKGKPLIIDAGPALTFTAAAKRDLLINVVTGRGSRLLAPESVADEVSRKASQQKRFAECESKFASLISHGQIEMLSDDVDDAALSHQVNRITGLGTRMRLGESKDLGETMVIAHALKLKQSGAEVRVFIDEWRGQQVALTHGLKVVSTESILIGAIALKVISDRGEMRKVYDSLREFDDGLVHIDQTQLLDRERYRCARS